VEGLFGVQPDLIAGEIRIRPGFPSEWNHGSLKHKGFDLAWKRDGMAETYEFTSRLAKLVPLALSLPARTTSLPIVMCNGKRVECAFDAGAVGNPTLRVRLSAQRSVQINIVWHGRAPMVIPAVRTYQQAADLELPRGVGIEQIDDSQRCLGMGGTGLRASRTGFHTVFANVHEGDAKWALPLSFEVKSDDPEYPDQVKIAPVPSAGTADRLEAVGLDGVLRHHITDIFTRVYAEPRSEYCSLAFADNLLGGWANPDGRATIDDAGLRAAGGLLKTAVGVGFATPSGSAPNCLFLSYWKQDEPAVKIPLSGRARGIYLLMAGTTLTQCSRMQHGTVSIAYADGTSGKLALRNPETWWPIEQDYLLDDYLFVNNAPLPPRVDLRTGQTRVLDEASFHGKGRTVPGGAATILHLPLDPAKDLASLQVGVDLYGIVVGLMAATLTRA
jgi:hypothetical protein